MNTTDLQEKFIQSIVYEGVSGSEAARRAGYSHASARQTASQLLSTPHIQAAIRNEQYKHLNGTLASKAIKTLETIMDDITAPVGARVDCAKTILDRSGLIAPKALPPIKLDKPVKEMTKDELITFIEATKKEIAKHELEQLNNVIESE